MKVIGGERAEPRRDEAFSVDKGVCPGVTQVEHVLPIPTPQPDGDEPARVVVGINRPIVADEVVQVGAAPERLPEHPPFQVNRASAVPAHRFVTTEAVQEATKD